jgi:hypothetical protein
MFRASNTWDLMKLIWDDDPLEDATREQNGNCAVSSLTIVTIRFAGYDPNDNPVVTLFYHRSIGRVFRPTTTGIISPAPGTDVPQWPCDLIWCVFAWCAFA